jgi:hypothetical protein
MENPSNVLRLKLLAALSYISIATLGAIFSQPMFATEVDPEPHSTTAVPELASKSDPLLIARNPKIKRRQVRSAKSVRRTNKRKKAPIAQTTVQPSNEGTPPAPVIPQDRSSETTPSIPGNNRPLDQAPIPTTVEPTRRSTSRDNYSVNVESYYSSWSDNFGNSGSQFITPLTVTYAKDNFNVGIRSAFINSNFNGVLILDGQKIGTRQGSVSTQSDTSLSFAYNLNQSDFPVRFNLDFNLPTGKATLVGDEKNAIMDGSLVQQTRFGEGLNIAPGISVSHAFGQKDVVGLGLSYIIKGQFNPNGDVANSEIKPGNETVASLQYQHLESNWMLSSGLIYTNYSNTQRGGKDYYRSGDRLDANVTGTFIPFDGHRVQLSGRYFTQYPNTIANFLTGDLVKESANSNGNALYLGLDWSIATDSQQKGRVHALVDYLSVQANSYDRINDLYNAGRDKFSVGVGYDYSFSPSTNASIQAKYFQVLDKATPITQQDIRSTGTSIFATLKYNF